MSHATSRKPSFAAVLVFTLCVTAGWLMLDQLRRPQPVRAPSVSFTLLGAPPLELRAMRGRPVLVNFWATTCDVCRREQPQLAALYRALHGRGLELIGVAMPYDPPHLVAAYARRARIPYPVALDIDAVVLNSFGGVRVTPTTFLIGPDGTLLQRREGVIDFVQLRRSIEALLPGATPESALHAETVATAR